MITRTMSTRLNLHRPLVSLDYNEIVPQNKKRRKVSYVYSTQAHVPS